MPKLEQWIANLKQSDVAEDARVFYQQFGNVDVKVSFRHPLLQTAREQMSLLRLRYPVFAPHPTRALLEDAIAVDAPSRVLYNTRNLTTTLEQFEILGFYYSSPLSTLSSIGDEIGFTKEWARQQRDAGIDVLSNATQYIKRRVGVETLPPNKPLYWQVLEKTRTRLNPAAPTLARLLVEGVDLKVILQRLNIVSHDLKDSEKRMFAQYGIEIPPTPKKPSEIERLRKVLVQGNRDEIKIALSGVVNLRSLFVHLSATENPAVYSISKVIKAAGLHVNQTDIGNLPSILEEAGIYVPSFQTTFPSGKTAHTYFIAATSFEVATKALASHPQLQKYKDNPVQQLLGPDLDQDLPTTTALMYKPGYAHVGNVLQQLGYCKKSSSYEFNQIFGSDCPVPILTYNSRHNSSRSKGYYFPTDQKNLLIQYLKSKLGI